MAVASRARFEFPDLSVTTNLSERRQNLTNGLAPDVLLTTLGTPPRLVHAFVIKMPRAALGAAELHRLYQEAHRLTLVVACEDLTDTERWLRQNSLHRVGVMTFGVI